MHCIGICTYTGMFFLLAQSWELLMYAYVSKHIQSVSLRQILPIRIVRFVSLYVLLYDYRTKARHGLLHWRSSQSNVLFSFSKSLFFTEDIFIGPMKYGERRVKNCRPSFIRIPEIWSCLFIIEFRTFAENPIE